MTAEQNVYTVLAAVAALNVYVGGRIYPVEAPAGATLPFLVYQRLYTEPISTHEQMDASVATHIDGVHFQMTVIATTIKEAVEALYQARLAVEHSAGLQAIWLDERSIPRDENALAYGHAGDFIIWKNPD